jgi:amino acid transporter
VNEPSQVPRDLPRTIGFFGAVGIMLGVIIGSGIFRTPHDIAQQLGSPAVVLLMWVAGGVLSLLGALTYTELAVVFPRSGGLYNFLYQGFGPRVAFIFGWTYMLITKPFAASAIARIFAEYLHLNDRVGRMLIEHFHYAQTFKTQWPEPIAVCVLLVALTWVNARGMRLGAGAGVVLTTIKALSLAAICVLAAVLPGGSAENFRSGPAPGQPPITLLAAIAPVMSMILWTYDGWSDVGAVAGEVRNPQRTLPRVYLLGTLAAIGLYVAINAAYLYVMPLEEMRQTDAVASAVMQNLLGPLGATILTAMVLISTLGSTHASIITGARVTFAQAQDGLLYRFLSRVHPAHQTPAVALWTQCLLSCLAVLFLRNFSTLADGFIFTMWIFYGLAAAAVILLRVKRPTMDRPYRTPGYPVVPALFVFASAAMTALMIQHSVENPDEIAGHKIPMALVWLGVLAAGWPAYGLWRRLVTDEP